MLDDADKKSVGEMIAAAMKPVTETLTKTAEAQTKLAEGQTELAKSVKIVGDTLATLPPATKPGDNAADAANAGAGKDAAAGNAAGLTAEGVKKLIEDGITAFASAQQQTAKQSAERDAFIKDAKNGLANLPAEFVGKLGSDPAKWPDEAKGIAASWTSFVEKSGIKVPDVGGVTRDGGTVNGQPNKAAAAANSGALPDGLAKFAGEIDSQLQQIDAAKAAKA